MLFEDIPNIKRLYSMMLEPVCKKYSISRIEVDILLFLANNQQYDTAADIVERRLLTKSHVSAAIKELCSRGLISGSFAEGNKKSVHLKLLPLSDSIIEDGRSVQKEFFSCLFNGFSDEEALVIHQSFCKMSENIRKKIKEKQNVV
ncbi:MAG: MarR family winged helix-turn-helix transcriptional regulator [Oscillospiraceae bacterium]